ncbi:MAG: AAA family ATPase [Gallionella sp.]
MMAMTDTERAADALNYLDAGCDRESWVRTAMAAKSAGLDLADFDRWSASAENYKSERDTRAVWNSISENGGIGAGTLFALAAKAGWIDDRKRTASPRPALTIAKPAASPAKPLKQAANASAVEVWSRCIPATDAEPYIHRKQGKPDGLGVYPATAEPLKIGGVDMTGALVIPCFAPDCETLLTLQLIPIAGDKKNLPGASFGDGFFTVGEVTDRVYICEGIGTAWAVVKADPASAAVCCFGAGRMARVAAVLRAKYPAARLVIVPDRGKESQAADIAAAVAGLMVEMPADKPGNYDANDYLLEHGTGALSDLLQRAQEPPIEYALSVAFADELPDTFTPLDEIVEGVITAGDGSVIYGETNTCKTFCVIDMAAAVARGVPWMGRRTEPGLVIYLAAESPSSVRSRLQAYQKHHGVRVPNFAIVQSPIDLFDGDADTDKLIQLVQQIERQRGQPARLIIGDTLARLSAGANENAGQDMGQVVRRFDRIRNECKAHFMLVHHSGKNAAAGARGWSGVRAAVDTEIEVTDTVSGRCLEITKQRDLSTKGSRIGFRLDVVELGLTKWKSPATSCVVMPADAPMKQTNKRVSEVGGAVMEYLRTQPLGIKKRELVEHFADSYTSSAVYREIKKLVEAGQLSDCAGNIATLEQVRNDAKWC